MLSVGGGSTEMCVGGITVDKVRSRREMSADFRERNNTVFHRKFQIGDLRHYDVGTSHSGISQKTVWHCPKLSRLFNSRIFTAFRLNHFNLPQILNSQRFQQNRYVRLRVTRDELLLSWIIHQRGRADLFVVGFSA